MSIARLIEDMAQDDPRMLASQLPVHAHLYDVDGSMYMGRWRVIDKGTPESAQLLAETGYESVRLHHIMKPDHDRDLHSHPFHFKSHILEGWYDEQGPGGIVVRRTAGTSCETPRSCDPLDPFKAYYHRINEVSPGGVWTLFMMTPNTEQWWFEVKVQDSLAYVPAVKYLLRRGYSRESVRGATTE